MQGIVTGSYNFQKLAVSPDAIRSVYHAKVQLLLILIQSLNLEGLLQMIHDNIPFRFCCISLLNVLFSIQEKLGLKVICAVIIGIV